MINVDQEHQVFRLNLVEMISLIFMGHVLTFLNREGEVAEGPCIPS